MSKRPGLDDNADSERLPWLEPHRETIAAKRRVARRSHGGLVAVASLLAVLMAAMGGYWVGQRGAGGAPVPDARSKQAEIVAPVPPAQPMTRNEIEAAAEPMTGTEVEPVAKPELEPAPGPVASSKAPKKVAERAAPPPRKAKLRRADTRRPQYDRVVAKQREAVRTWPKMPSPGPAGQVIQLGAFSTRTRAEAAYRERTARYPLLSGMPQVIVPVITRPRGQVLYVLRLGTQTREQSQVVCRNLRRSGDHCLVIG